jgi:hypothetical protein
VIDVGLRRRVLPLKRGTRDVVGELTPVALRVLGQDALALVRRKRLRLMVDYTFVLLAGQERSMSCRLRSGIGFVLLVAVTLHG